MSENNESTTLNAEFFFQIRVIGQQIKLLTKVTKELKDEMDSMKHYNSGVDHQRSNFKRVVQNDKTDFNEFVDDNTNVGDDDHKFSSMGQGNMFGPNKARSNISLGHSVVFCQGEFLIFWVS